jgi:phosphate transport system permease protein
VIEPAASLDESATGRPLLRTRSLLLSKRAGWVRRLTQFVGGALLALITSGSVLGVLFIFYFVARDAIPFFQQRGLTELFTGRAWYPSRDPASFGALPIFFGSGLVTLGAALVAVPLGVLGAVCLSDILPFGVRQCVKPVIEVLAAIPSVAFGFFALVVFAPLLQAHGGALLATVWWCAALPVATLAVFVISDVFGGRSGTAGGRRRGRVIAALLVSLPVAAVLIYVGRGLAGMQVASGTNALNVSIILGIMALPTVISVSEDALQAAGRELREGAYALGSTRAETLLRVVIPAARSGILAAIILGIMRAVGETMVVWMASGNAAQIPHPWYNYLEPVRTLTATIAGDMGEADHVTGSARYHVLFALALALLAISLVCNLVSERVIRRSVRKHR